MTLSEKIRQAKQLGFEYPQASEPDMIERDLLKILFVCSMNQWRSPTAEKIYADKPQLLVRSCGTSRNARKTVSSEDLQWADIVFVMEQKQKQRLLVEFPHEMRFQEIHVLDIPDDYKFMDPELVAEILAAVDPILTRDAGSFNVGAKKTRRRH
ncbi:low molecular weight protein tyrosine phosphatase family protein [Blastopirellula marina]|uniref:Phosphotyrosine protein phosphatase I domain-containing protein n=1 Tax=Blastopirellula marina DSM 3645 TaxID=314230 RepID=A3ZV03_9BACT|nr:hypothetical protein [Blastopirellula marina]EAQ79739.1 hypothetical protein DSM3645_24560 [Blastopirellula marina DSM 3645]